MFIYLFTYLFIILLLLFFFFWGGGGGLVSVMVRVLAFNL